MKDLRFCRWLINAIWILLISISHTVNHSVNRPSSTRHGAHPHLHSMNMNTSIDASYFISIHGFTNAMDGGSAFEWRKGARERELNGRNEGNSEFPTPADTSPHLTTCFRTWRRHYSHSVVFSFITTERVTTCVLSPWTYRNTTLH